MYKEYVRKMIFGATVMVTAFMLNHIEVRAWWSCMYPSACFRESTVAVVDENGRRERDEMTEADYQNMTATSNFKARSYFMEWLK